MSRFESFLAQQFEEYMVYRNNLGYDTYGLRWVLKTVDRYLVSQNAEPSDLTPAFFLNLRASLRTQYKSINRVLSTTRMFFNYLLRIQYCQDNPLKDIPWLPEARFNWGNLRIVSAPLFSREELNLTSQAVVREFFQTEKIDLCYASNFLTFKNTLCLSISKICSYFFYFLFYLLLKLFS